jgi:hypothetical protein
MKRFLTGLLIFVMGAAILWLACHAMQIPALGFVAFCGWVLGLVLLTLGGGLAIGCKL